MKSAKRRRRYYSPYHSYPNAADSHYFAGKLLDGITSAVTGMGVITILFFLMTMYVYRRVFSRYSATRPFRSRSLS